jgi:hypothetical protein
MPDAFRLYCVDDKDQYMDYESELQQSINYLSSEQALKDVQRDAYWPKWDSPWWHMLLLHEMGQTKLIPATLIKKYVEVLNQYPVKLFPIHPEEMPEGVNPYRGVPCHCQMGNTYQVLAAWGVDVDQELPWIRPWFLRYQMSDGGLNCDNDAYLVKDEVPSSMVGTIAVFESILLYTHREWTREEKIFLEKGAKFLIERKLMLGSQTKYNATEQVSAKDWLKLCFPRFYLYDILRGLNALVLWSEKTQNTIPASAIKDVVNYLEDHSPDGQIKNERLSYQGAGTLLPTEVEEWSWHESANSFPLLAKLSAVGEVSPFLTKQWSHIKKRLI